jgi:hypothetical protein
MRYNDWANFEGLLPHMTREFAIGRFISEPHESVWYPGSDHLPLLKDFIFEACRYWQVERLGGVLITRIPPHGEVKPHKDGGWHAVHYQKLALQIHSAPGQVFWYEDGEFECEPGTIYTFDNSQPHAVYNRSDQQRVTCIICVKRDARLPPLWRSE